MSLYGPKQLAGSMRTVRKNTILVAEDIPEKDYGYRPVPESRSVTETLVHIVFRSQLDRYLHEEKHLSSLEGFDFGALFQKSKLEERARSKDRSEEHTSELQSQSNLVCRLLLEKKKKK